MRTSIVRRAARWCMVAVGLAAVVGAPPLAVANGAEFDGDPSHHRARVRVHPDRGGRCGEQTPVR